ncbi:hypothetical protein Tdes44962_MAKER03077 [Teratosphaeria destructans]|uniref:Uncharacterized protein n=1 Tax=Teratosphaeria destructans TaxID=418781 RepID=A0A9W7W1S6_9PEZI|nr:hypothetical protein Tdes44962_MAKER03077 [Teratosphaeria destructans]
MLFIEPFADQRALERELPYHEQDVIKKLQANAGANSDITVGRAPNACCPRAAIVRRAVAILPASRVAKDVNQRAQRFFALLPELLPGL